MRKGLVVNKFSSVGETGTDIAFSEKNDVAAQIASKNFNGSSRAADLLRLVSGNAPAL